MIARPSSEPLAARAFWRSALLLFVAMRAGDALNAVTGLFLVPKLLAPEALGAVLPLMQFGAVLTLPAGILATVFTRFLCAYGVAGEGEKARGLLRDTLLLALGVLALGEGVALGVVPAVCRWLHLQTGAAAAHLAVASALLAALVPMTTAALQATKGFGALAAGAVAAAVGRLAVMAALLPLLGLAGYFVGQGAALVITAAVALVALRARLAHAAGQPLPFGLWLADLRPMGRYALRVALGAAVAAVQGTAVTFAIRHRLCADDSAAYYLFSRFAEVATYCGTSLALVLFPYAVEADVLGGASAPLRGRTVGLLLALGTLLAAALAVLLPPLLPYLPFGEAYAARAPLAGYLALIATLNAAIALYSAHETARGRFRWLWVTGSGALLLCGLLFGAPGLTLLGALHRLFAVALGQLLALGAMAWREGRA